MEYCAIIMASFVLAFKYRKKIHEIRHRLYKKK